MTISPSLTAAPYFHQSRYRWKVYCLFMTGAFDQKRIRSTEEKILLHIFQITNVHMRERELVFLIPSIMICCQHYRHLCVVHEPLYLSLIAHGVPTFKWNRYNVQIHKPFRSSLCNFRSRISFYPCILWFYVSSRYDQIDENKSSCWALPIEKAQHLYT